MASIKKTPHYSLSQFGDSAEDKPSWRGDYTSDMSKIDSQMYRNETDALTATSTANTAQKNADSAMGLAKKNESDIGEQKSYFSALGVTSQETAQSLMSTISGKAEKSELVSLSQTVDGKANVSDVYTKTQIDGQYTKQGGFTGTAQQLNQRLQALEAQPETHLPICLCIGDSYANSANTANPDGTDEKKWPTQLRNIIGNDYQIKNYAVSGAGFGVSGKLFNDQINNAYNSSSLDNDNVAIIIIAGGRNDVANIQQMESYASTAFANARDKFPKARIISIPMLWHNAGMDMYGRQKAAGVAQAAAKNGVENVNWAWTWNVGNDSNFNADDIHPNADGAKVIASYMASAIRGTYAGRYEAATLTKGNLTSNVVASGGMVMVTLWGGDPSTSEELKNGISLPSWARASDGSTPNQIRVWGAGLTNSGNAVSGWLLTDLSPNASKTPRITYHGTPAGNNGCFACYPW